jgi:hypothetical protein
MKIFGSTRYVQVTNENRSIGFTPDVEPFEPYLRLEVVNQWDFNPNGFYLVFGREFSYYVRLSAKENNSTYHFSKLLKEEEMTEEYKELVKGYLEKL